MKQKKTISSIKQSGKKIVKRTSPAKASNKFSKRLLIGIGILFIVLFIIVFASSQHQSLQGDASSITPTFGSLGDCTTNGDCPTVTGSGGSGQQITSGPATSGSPTTITNPSASPATSTNPCISAENARVTAKSSGSQKGFLQLILQFFQLLLQLLEQLFGGGGNTTTPVGSIPTQGVQPSGTPVSTAPSQSPCPPASSAPSGTSQPTTVPTIASAPTGGTTAASCVTSAAMGRCPTTGYYTDPQIVGGTDPWVNQNIWGAGGTNYQQTLHASSAGDWYVTASVSNNTSGAVLTFPNTGWTMPTKTIDSYSTITSSWNVTMPTNNAISAGWAAYDLWFNNWDDEVMIQTDIVANSNYNCTSAASTTIDGEPWHVCLFGSERVVKPGTDDNNLRNEASGTVDVKAILQWLEQTGHLPASSVWTAGSFGFEITNTSGTTQTFGVNGFTWTSQ